MSTIFHSGYGYRKRLCENVTSWFLSKFLPHHQIEVEILHRGLKRENVLGWCDFTDENYKRPRQFLIELQTHMNEESYIKTLFHELTHLKQWVDGSLRLRYGKMHYCKEPVEFYEYHNRPHEKEAREQEEILYLKYILEKQRPVEHLSQSFFRPHRHLL